MINCATFSCQLADFLNLFLCHLVAWGTKGSTGVGNEKAKVTGSDGKGPQEAEIEITTKPEDQNILWQNMQKELRTPYVEQHQKRSIDAKVRFIASSSSELATDFVSGLTHRKPITMRTFVPTRCWSTWALT